MHVDVPASTRRDLRHDLPSILATQQCWLGRIFCVDIHRPDSPSAPKSKALISYLNSHLFLQSFIKPCRQHASNIALAHGGQLGIQIVKGVGCVISIRPSWRRTTPTNDVREALLVDECIKVNPCVLVVRWLSNYAARRDQANPWSAVSPSATP